MYSSFKEDMLDSIDSFNFSNFGIAPFCNLGDSNAVDISDTAPSSFETFSKIVPFLFSIALIFSAVSFI